MGDAAPDPNVNASQIPVAHNASADAILIPPKIDTAAGQRNPAATRSRRTLGLRVAEGSVTECHVDPREVFAPAILSRAAAVVLVHNHPSGDPQPSASDLALTRQLTEAGRALCIRVIDHVIVADGGLFSSIAQGALP